MSEGLAKLVWEDPQTNNIREYVLTEGATATIGRSSNNDIQIPEQRVSRQHAVVQYRDGIFMITDLDSANGTFVNDERITEPFPLFAGDVVRLFVPVVRFEAADEDDVKQAEESGMLISAVDNTGQGCLVVTSGPQEGQTIPLLLPEITVGRATTNATWQILLQDPSVSRPHARMERIEERWVVFDLGSSNGTLVNNTPVTEKGRVLNDGDTMIMGATVMLFRSVMQGQNTVHKETHIE